MNFPAGQSSASLERLQDEGLHHLSRRIRYMGQSCRVTSARAPCNHRPPTFVASSQPISHRNPGSIRLLLREPDLSASAFLPSTSFLPKSGGVLPRTAARNFKAWLKQEADRRGYQPLRDAIAEYFRTSRGVRCTAEQVVDSLRNTTGTRPVGTAALENRAIQSGWKILAISALASRSTMSEPGMSPCTGE